MVKNFTQGYYIFIGDTSIKIKLWKECAYIVGNGRINTMNLIFSICTSSRKYLMTNILISICHTMLLTSYYHQLTYQEVVIDVMCQEDAFAMTFKYHNPKWWCRMTFFYPKTFFKKFKCFGVCHWTNDAVLHLLQDVRGRKGW